MFIWTIIYSFYYCKIFYHYFSPCHTHLWGSTVPSVVVCVRSFTLIYVDVFLLFLSQYDFNNNNNDNNY